MENLERNCSYRIIFSFHWYLGVRTRQIIPGDRNFVSFFDPGAGVLDWKAVPGAGILTERSSGPGLPGAGGGGGGSNRSRWYLRKGDFSVLPMPLVSIVKDQSKLPESVLLGGQCLDRVMFCLKPIDFNDFSLNLTKYLMFPDSNFCVEIWNWASQKLKPCISNGCLPHALAVVKSIVLTHQSNRW